MAKTKAEGAEEMMLVVVEIMRVEIMKNERANAGF